MVKGINFGVDIINDVSGFEYDRNSLNILKNYKITKIIHHMQGTQVICKIIQNIKMFY